MDKNISEGRKAGYLLGRMVSIAGGGCCLLTFVIFALSAMGRDGPNPAIFFLFLLGMVLGVVGSIISNVAAKGLAGSGVILDPEKAREDLEPYARMSGGLTRDAMDEAGIPLEKVGQLIDRLGTGGTGASGGPPAGGAVQKVIMIKCQSCGKLNEEDSKFCQECGVKL